MRVKEQPCQGVLDFCQLRLTVDQKTEKSEKHPLHTANEKIFYQVNYSVNTYTGLVVMLSLYKNKYRADHFGR